MFIGMGLFGGLAKIVLAPINGVAEIVRDVSGENGEGNVGASICSMGVSSLIKGTAKSIKKGADEIIDD